MCNSYSNGLCLYYGVSIKEMNNKCDRGDCMKIVCGCGSDTFHKTIKDFIMCTECRSLIDISSGQPVGPYVYIGPTTGIYDNTKETNK